MGGPVAGLIAGLASAASDWVLVLAADLPFPSPQLAEGLVGSHVASLLRKRWFPSGRAGWSRSSPSTATTRWMRCGPWRDNWLDRGLGPRCDRLCRAYGYVGWARPSGGNGTRRESHS
jgi:hypothetical protein